MNKSELVQIQPSFASDDQSPQIIIINVATVQYNQSYNSLFNKIPIKEFEIIGFTLYFI